MDALDWIHAICQQIPDRGQHLYRDYGAYSNRTRKALPQKCGAEMKIIAVLTDPKVVDRIILHLQQTDQPAAPRAPPPIRHLLN